MAHCPRCHFELEPDDGEPGEPDYYEPAHPEPEYPCTAYIRGVVLSSEDAGMDPGTWRVGRLNDVCTPRGRRMTARGEVVIGIWRHPAGNYRCTWGIWEQLPHACTYHVTRNCYEVHAVTRRPGRVYSSPRWHDTCN